MEVDAARSITSDVFPVSPIVSLIYLIVYILAGMVIGALSGWIASLITKCGTRGFFKDVFLGALGYLVGFIGAYSCPEPRNTISYHVDGTLVTSTMNPYQHPARVAIAMAVLLPLLHELYRFKGPRPN